MHAGREEDASNIGAKAVNTAVFLLKDYQLEKSKA